MRTLKFTILATLAFAFSVATAQAASVDVIWQTSGTSSTVVTSSSAVVTGNIVLTLGTADTGIGGVGAGIELSADYSASLSVTADSQATLAGWFGLARGPDDGVGHYENILAEGDLYGSGATLAPGSSTVLGTITVHVGAGGGSVTVSNSGAGDDIIGAAGSVIGQFAFNAGTISIIPEPTTASLLGLGLVGLTVAGRRRRV